MGASARGNMTDQLMTRRIDIEGNPPQDEHRFSDIAVGACSTYIECDNQRCKALCAGLRCGGCKCMYYCSATCQKKDWKGHKEVCKAVKQQSTLPAPQLTEQELAEVFTTTDMHAICEFVLRACAQLEKDAEAYISSLQHTAQLLDSAVDAVPAEQQGGMIIERMRRADIYICLREYAAAQSLLKSTFKLANETDFTNHVTIEELADGYKEKIFRDISMRLAEVEAKLQDWSAVMAALQDAAPYLNMELTDEKHVHRTWLQMAAFALTEMGQHERAINIGVAAVECNRYFLGVYEPLVKACTNLGKHQEALLWRRRSVAYETPWDQANMVTLKADLARLEEVAEI